MKLIEKCVVEVFKVDDLVFDSLELAEKHVKKEEAKEKKKQSEIERRARQAEYDRKKRIYLNWMHEQLMASGRDWHRDDCYDWTIENFEEIAHRLGYLVVTDEART